RELETALSPGFSADTRAPSETGRGSRFDLPSPLGADLITNFEALRQLPLGEYLNRLFGGITTSDGPGTGQNRTASYLLPVALAVAALEAARRWRRSSKAAAARSRRARNAVLIGLPRTSR